MSSTREQFASTATDLVESDRSVALVYAEISGRFFGAAEAAHPDRVVNVGIREQLLVNVGAGMALSGMRPIVHTFGTFLVERAYEQIKLGFGHQDVGGVLVGSAGSFDVASGGRTHQAPGDVALLDALPGVHIHAPSTAAEVDLVLRGAVRDAGLHYVRVVDQTNGSSHEGPGFHVVRRGATATVVALGPVLDSVLEATTDLDVTVLYAHTVRPLDRQALRAAVGAASTADVVLVEPWLAGTSAHEVAGALVDLPHRLLSLGVGRQELRRYGSAEDHVVAHGLDAAGIRGSLVDFVGRGADMPG